MVAAFQEIIAQLEYVEKQVLNARMSDALDLPPEVLEDVGFLPSWDPYGYATSTADAGLVARAKGATETAAELCGRLHAQQRPAP